jgi:alpha-mannosidase
MNLIKITIALAAVFLLANVGTAQVNVPVFGDIEPLNGYAKELSGENIGYFSAYPSFAKVALLTRCTDGQKTIGWRTEAIPENYRGGYVYFRWMAAHSAGTSSGDRSFDLYINGGKALTFVTKMKQRPPYWTASGGDGVAVVFETLTADGHNDAHGRMYLRVPAGKFPKGQPLTLKVAGHAENSNDWYMTFKYRFEEKIEIYQYPALVRKDGELFQNLFFKIDHIGGASTLRVVPGDGAAVTLPVQYGYNTLEIPVPAVQKSTPLKVFAEVQGYLTKRETLELQPVQKRTIFFVHHSHNDIGYSHIQEEVERIQNENIFEALRIIRKTKSLPEAARFRWNIESQWAVENFMKIATPQQQQEFVQDVKDGYIALSALYTNVLTGLCRPEELMHLTDYSNMLREKYSIQSPSIMMSDIPGFSWGIVPAQAANGVRYFSSGPNYMGYLGYTGDRVGHSNNNWGDRPFYWVSPSGQEKILFWMAGRGYSSWHGTKPGDLAERGKEKILQYMAELQQEGYPYEMVQWRYNTGADNGGVDSSLSDFVAKWNEQYESPKIVVSNIHEMFRLFEEKYGAQLPAYAGDLTPYWEDGAMSSARETMLNRQTSEKLNRLTTLSAIARPQAYDADAFYEAWRKVILFDEHTWGAYNSISEPDSEFARHQWEYKKRFALDAAAEAAGLEGEILSGVAGDRQDVFAVFNTTSYETSQVVYLPAAASVFGRQVVDEKGEAVPAQVLQDGSIAFYASGVPALGAKKYRVQKGQPAHFDNPFTVENGVFSNGLLRLKIDETNGSIVSLNCQNVPADFIQKNVQDGVNSYHYVAGLSPAKAVTNGPVKITVVENGPVLLSILIESQAPGTRKLVREVRLLRNERRVLLTNTVDKLAIREKESVHFGFPFQVPEGVVRYDVGWGYATAEAEQLPGANRDYLSAASWIDVSNQEQGVTVIQRESPLFEVGEMIDERKGEWGVKDWKKQLVPSSTLYAYAMNNYWHTNYKADQAGEATFRFALVPHGLFNDANCYREAARFNQPLSVAPVAESYRTAPSLFSVSNEKVAITLVQPLDGGYKLRLFNTSKAPQTTRLTSSMPGEMYLRNGGESLLTTGDSASLTLPGLGMAEVFFQIER